MPVERRRAQQWGVRNSPGGGGPAPFFGGTAGIVDVGTKEGFTDDVGSEKSEDEVGRSK